MKLKVREKWNPYNYRCQKFNVKIYFYGLNNYKKGKNVHVFGAGLIKGEDKNKESFFRSLVKDKKITNIEREGNFFMGEYRESTSIAKKRGIDLAYNPSIIHLKPIIFDETGWEEWEFASPNRELFENILESKRIKNKEIEFKLFYFKDKKITNIMPLALSPKLTPKQEAIINLAVQEGYYDSPRKIDLTHLAKKSGISLSTFQVHLRKAEKKIIPFVFNKNIIA